MNSAGNREYELDELEREIVAILKEEKRVNPLRLRKITGTRKQYVNEALQQLKKAGFVKRINTGLWEYIPEKSDAGPTEAEVSELANEIRELNRELNISELTRAANRLEEITNSR